jgi:hypothetical protein
MSQTHGGEASTSRRHIGLLCYTAIPNARIEQEFLATEGLDHIATNANIFGSSIFSHGFEFALLLNHTTGTNVGCDHFEPWKDRRCRHRVENQLSAFLG